MKTKRPQMFAGFTNIRVLPSGYQVTITRAKVEVSRHFAGHSERSLNAALKYRDRLLQDLPNKRLNAISPRLLRAAGLKEPPPGVYHNITRRAYAASWFVRGKLHTRQFGYQSRTELEAFLAALKVRKAMEEAADRR